MAKTKPPIDAGNSTEDVTQVEFVEVVGASVDDSTEDVTQVEFAEVVGASVDDSTEDVTQVEFAEVVGASVDDSTEDVTPTVYVVIDNIRHDGTQYAAGDELTDLLDLQASVLVACGVIKPKAD